jgi:hypothetical protein
MFQTNRATGVGIIVDISFPLRQDETAGSIAVRSPFIGEFLESQRYSKPQVAHCKASRPSEEQTETYLGSPKNGDIFSSGGSCS